MIEFHLDNHSGVAPYLQIVQQVKQALRLGLLEVGDQLPTVREAVTQITINPNTVMKAYRELEREGLIESRPGQGTFVQRTLAAQRLSSRAGQRERAGSLHVHVSRHPERTRGNRMSNALETNKLSKRYGRTWALQDCTLNLPAGRVAALVGPNGAGKTTLLHLAVGLLEPTAGEVQVFGCSPSMQPKEALPRLGFVAQDTPLYKGFTVAEMLTLGRQLNPRFDDALARARMQKLGIPLARRAGKLSGGQQAQVALVLALAKRPDLLLLDEPLSSLDPLARREFLRTLLDAVAESGLTVLLSSHIIGDLERVCDYLIILSASQVQLAGDIQEIAKTHKRLIGPRQDEVAVASVHTVIEASHTERQTTLLVRANGPLFDPSWEVQEVSMEDIVLAYLSQQAGDRWPALPSAREQNGREVFK